MGMPGSLLPMAYLSLIFDLFQRKIMTTMQIDRPVCNAFSSIKQWMKSTEVLDRDPKEISPKYESRP